MLTALCLPIYALKYTSQHGSAALITPVIEPSAALANARTSTRTAVRTNSHCEWVHGAPSCTGTQLLVI